MQGQQNIKFYNTLLVKISFCIAHTRMYCTKWQAVLSGRWPSCAVLCAIPFRISPNPRPCTDTVIPNMPLVSVRPLSDRHTPTCGSEIQNVLVFYWTPTGHLRGFVFCHRGYIITLIATFFVCFGSKYESTILPQFGCLHLLLLLLLLLLISSSSPSSSSSSSSSSSVGATTLGGFWPALRFRSTLFYLYTSLSSFSLSSSLNPLVLGQAISVLVFLLVLMNMLPIQWAF